MDRLPIATATLISFSWGGWLAVAFLVGLLVWGRRMAPRAWSGRHTYLAMEDPPHGWPYGGPLWRGYVRTLAVLPVALWVTLITLIVGRFTPNHGGAGLIPAVVAMVAFVVACLVLLSIVLFAAPQRLIPPAVRGRPGAISEWRAARRERPPGARRSRARR